MRKKNIGTSLSFSNSSQEHSWMFYVRRVREIWASAANSENDMIFWEALERNTAFVEKVITWAHVGPQRQTTEGDFHQ